MLRLLLLMLSIWGSSAFAFNSTRIQCTSQNALLELVPMTVYFQTASGVVMVQTPFHFWIAQNRAAAKQIEQHRADDDRSPVLVMSHAKLQWKVEDTRVDLNLEPTFKGEEFVTTNEQQAMLVSTKEKQFLAGYNGWIFSCAIIGK